jgi:F-type H+-transporting ATPase subunit delta
MKFSAIQYAQALFDSISDTDPKDHEKVINNFAQILSENNDIKLFEQISDEFERISLKHQGKKLAHVTSARPISQANHKQITDFLNQYLKTDVKIKEKIDGEVLGGVLIKVDDIQIDATVKNQLEDLKKHIASNN